MTDAQLPRGTSRREPWRDRSVCKQDPGAHWFPDFREEGKSKYIDDCRERCRQSCSICPVFKDCLEMALSEQHQHGIFADTSPRERNAILRGRGVHV